MGRLDMFWKGSWGTICGMSRVSADVACYQMGYGYAAVMFSYATADNYTKSLVPRTTEALISIDHIYCGYDNRYKSALHLLRCFYLPYDHTSACTHANDTIVRCLSEEIPGIYNTGVRLVMGPYASSGNLEVYINNTWGNVCNKGFSQSAADTVCRQIGYTNAFTFGSTTTKSATVVWLDGVECGPESHACLNRCFKTPLAHATCPNEEYVTVNCMFDVRINRAPWSPNMTAGNVDICSTMNTDTINTTNLTSVCKAIPIPVISGVFALLVVAIIVLVIIVACFAIPLCPLAQCKQRKDYSKM